MIIEHFSGMFQFLSNFYPCEIVFEDYTYASIEHAYQAAKTHDQMARMEIRKCSTAGRAKRFGNSLIPCPYWEDAKQRIMLGLVRQKFQNRDLASMLITTGNAQLIEGNEWGDAYWGVSHGIGMNKLGKILMKVRAELVVTVLPVHTLPTDL